jgi:lipopolysaccharide/colanic/teichoic acid biosynthesis glycosyltransferase
VKRLVDLVVSLAGLLAGSVVLVPVMVAVWLQDRHSPFYVASRAGRGGQPFRMVKLRSMRVLADQAGGSSTAGDDPRITAVGRFVRRWKLDELTQLWNVLLGDMSLVGPRPQVMHDIAFYTSEERELLAVRPGITDLASIVFADEGEVLRGVADPDLRYNQVIRPWKSRLALLYVRQPPSVWLDLRIIWLTLRAIASREFALAAAAALVAELGGGEDLTRVAARREPLVAAPPPGAQEIVQTAPGR